MPNRNRVEHRVWRRGALIAASCAAMLPVTVWPSQAKAPGATWCYRDVCHRVRTVGETQRLVGKTMVLEASFYDEPRLDRFNRAKHTSNGEVFDANNPARVAAANFPDGTELMLRNPANGRTSHVRVNDFGPFLRSRLLDVTKRVAKDLDFAQHGVTSLEVTVIAAPPRLVVVSRKNRCSLPTRGLLGALEPDAAASRARTLIAAAQTTGPAIASVPQTERTAVSAAGLLAGYDILGRVRSILGLPRPEQTAELAREALVSSPPLPDATPARPEPSGGKLAQLAGESRNASASARSEPPGTIVPAATESEPQEHIEPVATPVSVVDRVEAAPESNPAPAVDIASATLPALLPPEPQAVPLQPVPQPAPAPLTEALVKARLPLPSLPDLPLAGLAPPLPEPAQVAAIEPTSSREPVSQSFAPLAVASTLDLMEIRGLAHSAITSLSGSMPMSSRSLLLTIMAMLSTGLFLASRYRLSPGPVAPPSSRRSRLRLTSLRMGSRPRTGVRPAAPAVDPAPDVPSPAAVEAPQISGSHIGNGVTVTGTVASRGTLVIAGTVRGRITADTLIVLDGGRIESDGPVEARVVRCAGAIYSSVSATELHIASTGALRGPVTVTLLSMEYGALLDSEVTHRPAAG